MNGVLMTTDAVGGVWDYALELCAGLGMHGIHVVLATMGPTPAADQVRAVRALPNVDLVVGSYKLEWQDDPWADLDRAAHWLLALRAQRGLELVHLNGYAAGALPFEVPTLVVGHSCVFSWWRAVRGHDAPVAWQPYRDAVRAGLRGADAVVAPSRFMADELRRWYGPLDDVRIIPNGRSVQRFQPVAKQPVVLTAGRLWDDAKNVAALVRVASQLPWRLVVAGSAHPDGGGGVVPVGEAPAAASIDWLGRIDSAALARRYASAAIYALPARYEPFGLSVLEAALSGCALVLGDLPSLRDLWNGVACFVPPDDDQALVRTITDLATDPVRRAALGRGALDRAKSLSAASMVRGYLDLYSKLMTDHGRAATPPLQPETVSCAS